MKSHKEFISKRHNEMLDAERDKNSQEKKEIRRKEYLEKIAKSSKENQGIHE